MFTFQAEVQEFWESLAHVDLVANQTKILGPLSCFACGCQVLGWQLDHQLTVVTKLGRTLHLLSSPFEEWVDLMTQDWISFAWGKCKWKPDWAPLHVSIYDWQSLWGVAKALPHFTCKFRVFGLLSGTARAHINHTETPKCELCGSEEAGQRHLALYCPKTQELRQLPKYRALPRIHSFTRCTGIPCRTHAWSPWKSLQSVESPTEFSGRCTFFYGWFSKSSGVR